MSCLCLYLLGPPRIELDGRSVQVDTRKAIALLAYLAMTRERHRRDALVNLLWPESDQSHGRAALRRTLSALRKAIVGEWLDVDRETVALALESDIWLDVDQFGQHLAECRSHEHPPAEVCPACLPCLRAAVTLHRGDFLTGFGLRDSLNFDDWQFFQTETLRRKRTGALRHLVQGLCAQGDLETATGYARQWLDLDRLDENAHAQLMLIYAWSGRHAAALRQYQECARILESSLGVSPQAPLADLYRAVVEGRVPPPPFEQAEPHAQQDQPALPVVQTILSSAAPAQTVPGLAASDQAGQASAEGEKHVVTILVADASASLAGVAELSVEDEALRMRALAQAIGEVAGEYGGRVERVLGHTVLAAFGVTRTHESDPELAIRAALLARQAVRELGQNTSMGIYTGEIYVGAENTDRSSPLSYAGSVVDRAAHLARQAQPGQILVGQATYHLARRAFKFAPRPMDLGEPGPLKKAYRVERLLARPRKARGFEGLRSTLVGRASELGSMQQAFARVLDGRGQMVSLIGEAGVGKSRLVAELREQALAPDDSRPLPLWLEGRCLELGTPTGYAPVIDMLREYLAWRPGKEDHQRRESIVYALRRLAEQGHLTHERVQEMGPLLARLLSVPWDDEWEIRVESESPDQVRHRTFLALHDWICALIRQRPVVLVFEDLHWADTLSLDLISLLMEALPQGPLMLLCVYRPEREHRCWHLATVAAQKCRERYTELTLRELSHAQSQQMVRALLVGESLAPSIEDRVWSQSQGNPFYIEEVVRSLVDAGIVYQEGQTWGARSSESPVPVPASVQSVILSRVDRLDARTRHVLQLASVIGRIFQQQVLAHLLTDQTDLAGILWELEERALVYQERAIPEVEYSFKHVLTQEAVYHNLPQSRRAILHRQVAQAIEALYPESRAHSEQLAHHYDRGGDVERAVTYLMQAGEKAKQVYANKEAITHLNRRLELLSTLPESSERDRLELDTLIALGVPLVVTQGHSALEVRSTYDRARALSQKLGDAGLQFHALMGLRRSAFLREGVGAALELGAHLLALAQRTGESGQLARAHALHAEVLRLHGDFAQSRHHCEQGLAYIDPQERLADIFLYGNDTGIVCQNTLAEVLWPLGYPDQAAAESQDVLATARKLAHPFSLVFALRATAVVRQLRGEPQIVQRQAQAAMQLSREHGFPLYLALTMVQHGWALAAQGEARVGIQQIQQGIAARRETGATTLLPDLLVWLVQAYAQAGMIEQAIDQLDEAQRMAMANGEHLTEAEMLRLRGELLLATNKDPEEAEACFQRALDVARRQEARSWELRAATSMARLWQRQGRVADARALLGEVYNWFSEGLDTADLIEARELLEALGRTESVG